MYFILKYFKTNTDDTSFYLCIRTRINSEVTAKIKESNST